MTSNPATTHELTDVLTDLEGAEPPADTPKPAYCDDIEGLVTRWRGWIDDVKVRADLGRMDGRDELQKLVSRLENAWLVLKNEAGRAEEDADISVDDFRRDAKALLDDLRRAGRATVSRLQADV